MRPYLLLLSIILFSCQKGTDDGGVTPPVTVAEKTELNVAYGTDPLQKLDIYLPGSRSVTSTKVIIMIHGGAWSSGDKTDFNSYVDTLKKRLPGYAIFNINYRLAGGTTNLFPTQETDVKSAVEFINGKRADYAISDKFVLLGASAGGHLALLQAYKYPASANIKAVVDFFGPTDLTDMYNNPASIFVPSLAIAQLLGGTPTTNPTIYQNSSPINYVTVTSPPTIILQGGLDPLVNPSQSVALNTKLQTMTVPHQYVFYPTEMHGWTGTNLSDSFDKIIAFLALNVN